MVEYSEFVSLVFEQAPSNAEATEVVSWAADRWNDRRDDLQDASKREVRDWLARKL